MALIQTISYILVPQLLFHSAHSSHYSHLGIQDIITNMKSEFNVWYLDDGTLGGDANTVLEDAKEI